MNTDFARCVTKARAGDADAFAELYSLVYKDLYRIALVNLKNQHDASDVVSDTVLEAFSSIKKLKDEKAFKAWIIKILTVKINPVTAVITYNGSNCFVFVFQLHLTLHNQIKTDVTASCRRNHGIHILHGRNIGKFIYNIIHTDT